MDKFKNILIFILLVSILGFLIFWPEHEPLPPTVITTVDTVESIVIEYIDQDPIYIEKKVYIKDTVYVNGVDTIATEVAALDTTFADSARISLDYYIRPSIFQVQYTPAPIKTKEIVITKENTVFVDTSKFWDKFKYGFPTGIATSAILVYLLK